MSEGDEDSTEVNVEAQETDKSEDPVEITIGDKIEEEEGEVFIPLDFLLTVPGLGKSQANRIIMMGYKDKTSIIELTEEELLRIPDMPRSMAKRIVNTIKESQKKVKGEEEDETDENQKGSQGTEASVEKNPRDSPNEDASSEKEGDEEETDENQKGSQGTEASEDASSEKEEDDEKKEEVKKEEEKEQVEKKEEEEKKEEVVFKIKGEEQKEPEDKEEKKEEDEEEEKEKKDDEEEGPGFFAKIKSGIGGIFKSDDEEKEKKEEDKPEEQVEEKKDAEDGFKIEGVDDNILNILKDAGYQDVSEVKEAIVEDLTMIDGIDEETAKKIYSALHTE